MSTEVAFSAALFLALRFMSEADMISSSSSLLSSGSWSASGTVASGTEEVAVSGASWRSPGELIAASSSSSEDEQLEDESEADEELSEVVA